MQHPFNKRLSPNWKFSLDDSANVVLEDKKGTSEKRQAKKDNVGLRKYPVPVEYLVEINEQLILALRPTSGSYKLHYQAIDSSTLIQASSFAVLRHDSGEIIIESPNIAANICCYEPVVASLLWLALAQPINLSTLVEKLDMSLEDCTHCVELMRCAGLIRVMDEDYAEINDHSMMWSAHEMMFHFKSRLGIHDKAFGATYSFRDTCDAPPARYPSYPGTVIKLAEANIDALLDADMTLTKALESRRSINSYDADNVISLDQLGQFLFRVARMTEFVPAPSKDQYEAIKYVYPTGGAMGDLELYVIVSDCNGLQRGAYHYDSFEHHLVHLESAPEAIVDEMLSTAKYSTATQTEAQILLVFSSRFTRGFWKYSSMYYAATLKNVGALMQTCYLVATAMDLAPCSIGAGNIKDFSDLTEKDPLLEGSVGEFVLGTKQKS